LGWGCWRYCLGVAVDGCLAEGGFCYVDAWREGKEGEALAGVGEEEEDTGEVVVCGIFDVSFRRMVVTHFGQVLDLSWTGDATRGLDVL
jgi:hypothetical protein